ncbi:hypothetical protein MMC32_005723 [Xylographa parallela]|nr:hypothetical protein [Xylographa parallela]
MSSISRISAALGTAHNEANVALASINFDFSLFRIEAPQEFQILGNVLSPSRRKEAEDGESHRTARRLGALFEDIFPDTPQLLKVYGARVSEISQSPSINPKGTREHGMFASRVGADGTSIWAAATSGTSALAVNLLACMLARLWSGPEATSLWSEIVTERRLEIEANCNSSQPKHVIAQMAAQQDITRTQLANWDASARAWLRSADEAKKREQTQLMLIVNNCNIPVNTSGNTYKSVIQSLRTALTTLNNLVAGMPQCLQDGAVLLGLSAWHLYPDLLVLGNAPAEVAFNDSLIDQGGVLTVGLNYHHDRPDEGVYWSLPLSHIRFYGDPVVHSRSAGIDGSRMTMQELQVVALGNAVLGWEEYENDPLAAAESILVLWECLIGIKGSKSNRFKKFLRDGSSWLHMLFNAARDLIESEGLARETLLKAFSLGQRRGAFLCHTATLGSFFNLCETNRLLSILTEDGGVFLFREFAKDLHLLPGQAVISIQHVVPKDEGGPLTYPEYATAVPISQKSSKRARNGKELQKDTHARMVAPIEMKAKRWEAIREGCYCIVSCPAENCSCNFWALDCSNKCHAKGITERVVPCIRTSKKGARAKVYSIDPTRFARFGQIESKGEKCYYWSAQSGCESIEERVWKNIDGKDPTAVLSLDNQFLTTKQHRGGKEFDTISLLIHGQTRSDYVKSRKRKLDIQLVKKVLLSGLVDSDAFINYFGSIGNHRSMTKYIRSLRVLASAVLVYKLLPSATIPVSICDNQIEQARWIPLEGQKKLHFESDNLMPYPLDRPSTFACIAMFESGSMNLDPKVLSEVMAMSSGNSIYVAAPLLCDPSEIPRHHEIRRIIGNVGRAGIAMLIQPQDPKVRRPDLDSWAIINHNTFDGELVNSFDKTSLHLSFTHFEMPINVEQLGAQDTDAFLMEALVSVHEQGKWVADINVLSSLQSNLIQRLELLPHCSHSGTAFPKPLTSIDIWDELIDQPNTTAIFRAHGNCNARLAAAAIAVQRGHRTYVCPPNVCWTCFSSSIKWTGSKSSLFKSRCIVLVC